MKWIPNVDKSLRILTWTFIATIGYHISILLQIIPYEYAWGGRLKSEQEMFQFETFSLLLNVLFLVFSIVLLKKKALQKTKLIKAVFYVFAALFFLCVGAKFGLHVPELNIASPPLS